MTEENKILLNNSRKQIIYYISRIIANSPIDKKKLEKLGAALITLQNNVFTQVIKNKDDKHIQALEYQLTIDKSDLDKEIHTQALNDLKTALNKK